MSLEMKQNTGLVCKTNRHSGELQERFRQQTYWDGKMQISHKNRDLPLPLKTGPLTSA